MPGTQLTHPIIRNLEQHQLPTPKRIEELQSHRRDHSAEEAPPHNLRGEEIRHFLKTEEDAADWRAERDRHARRTCCAQDFTAFCWSSSESQNSESEKDVVRTFVVLVLVEIADDRGRHRSAKVQ